MMAWYQVKGNNEDTVVSSRIRFARNLQGYPFAEGLSAEKATEIISRIEQALDGLDFVKTDMNALSPTAARALAEQHLISPAFASSKRPRALFRAEGKSISLMALEEDHIRLQCILPGLSLYDAYRFVCECDDRLDEKLPLAFDKELGYLTRCPTNLGTGMRASVMLFLPALTDAGYIPSLADQLAKMGLTIRGTFGEGTAAQGALYQISNQVTLGISEKNAIDNLKIIATQLIQKEQQYRKQLNRIKLEDRCMRSLGILKNARILTSSEMMTRLGDIKLGQSVGIIGSDILPIKLLIEGQPNMIMRKSGGLSPDERDIERANIIRNSL